MKKILNYLIVVLALFTLVGCGEENTPVEVKELTTPSNVEISEEGNITWDSVENATSYIVTINGESFVVQTNSYQVKDLKKDFSVTIKALADGYTTSQESESKSFKGTSEEDKKEMVDYVVSSFLGSKEDVEDQESYDNAVKSIEEACAKAYEYDVDVNVLKSVLDPINKLEDPEFKDVAICLLTSLTTLDDDQITGLAVFGDYYLQIVIDDFKGMFDEDDEDSLPILNALNQINELLSRNDSEIAVAIGHAVSQGVKVYNRLSLKVIPQIGLLMQSEDIKSNPKLIVEIKNSIVKALLENPIADEDLAVMLSFVKDAIPVLTSIMDDDADIEGVPVKPIFTLVAQMLESVDINELATEINNEVVEILNSLSTITEDLLKEAFEYEDAEKIVTYIVLKGFNNYITEINVKGSDLKAIAEMVWNYFSATDETTEVQNPTLKDMLGLPEEDYEGLFDSVATVINDVANVVINYMKDENNLSDLMNLMDLNIETTESSSTYYVVDEGALVDYYIKKVLDDKNYATVETLSIGTEYTVQKLQKDGTSLTYYRLNLTIKSHVNGTYCYDYDEYEVNIENIDVAVPVVKGLINAFSEKDNIVKDVQDLAKLLSRVEVISEESVKTILGYIADASEEDQKKVVNDLYNVLNLAVDYVNNATWDYTTEEIINAVTEFFTEENGAVVKTLITDLADLLESVDAFPMNLEFNNGELSISADSKEEFLQVTDIVDSFIEKNKPAQ